MSQTKITGAFVSNPPLPEGVVDAGLVRVGIAKVSATGVTLTERRSIRFLPTLLGLVGGLMACPAPLLLTWGLDAVGFDLLAIRRGYTLVAVFTMVFFGLGFTGVSTASAWLFSRENHHTVAREDFTVSEDGAYITFVWSDGDRRVGSMLFVEEEQRAGVLSAL